MGRGGSLNGTHPAAVTRGAGAAAAIGPRRRVSPFVVRDSQGNPKYGGCLLKIGGRFYLSAESCSLRGVQMPMVELENGERVYPIEIQPEFAHVVASYWHRLGASSVAGIYTAPELSERLREDGLDKIYWGGVNDDRTRFWFREIRKQTLLPLTSFAGEDGQEGFGCARSSEDINADIQGRAKRRDAAGPVFKRGVAILEGAEQGEDWRSWRLRLDRLQRAEKPANAKVIAALVSAMDQGRVKGDDLADVARAADDLGRQWNDSTSIRPLIRKLRAAGVPISATTGNPPGYWIAETPSDYRAWLEESYGERFLSISEAADDLEKLRALWFPQSEAEEQIRARFCSGVIRPGTFPRLAPSVSAVEKLNRVREAEARHRQKTKPKLSARERAEIERDQIAATLVFKSGFWKLTNGMKAEATDEERAAFEEWESAKARAKGKRVSKRRGPGSAPGSRRGSHRRAAAAGASGTAGQKGPQPGSMPTPAGWR